jgi:site-specific recombinase XerD
MALPILHRFIYRIKMLPLTEESTRLVFKCLSKYLKPIPFGKGALWVVLPCVRSNRYSATWRSDEVQTALCSSVPMAPPLTRTVFTERLRQLLSQAGITGHFGSHSFRIGAATTAGLAGVPEHMIQTLGRWSSSVYLAYRRTPRNLLASVTRMLC